MRILATLVASLLLISLASSCAVKPSLRPLPPASPKLVEPTTGVWVPDPSDDWVTTCTYTPQATVSEYLSCLITTKNEITQSH